jgi:hypothetical protein
MHIMYIDHINPLLTHCFPHFPPLHLSTAFSGVSYGMVTYRDNEFQYYSPHYSLFLLLIPQTVPQLQLCYIYFYEYM